jgi:hypothetical protein|nr:MAG TPA: hypothetical protein [Caudoviricetes sp.]
MKRYKLLKNLPFAKAGTIFRRISFKSKDGLSDYDYLETNILLEGNQDETVFSIKRNYFINNFNEWFEEIKEPEQIYYVDSLGGYVSKLEKHLLNSFPTLIANLKSIGNYFETREEAKKYLEYLKAKEVIKQDTKGFKPNWKNCENKYYGYWNSGKDSLGYLVSYITKYSDICFKTEEDIEESFEKHPDEWKTYLTYEQ